MGMEGWLEGGVGGWVVVRAVVVAMVGRWGRLWRLPLLHPVMQAFPCC